ncbi:MAG: Exonuclease RNase and polymerase, partial [Phycisphaerales bacterium]|nr:Exonuclease RNase and polymerase [Phycisphaerales bacterium]
VDLEATCWDDSRDRARMEIIEIGAVEMPSANDEPTREFSRFVRPIVDPTLSDFCRELTSIRQQDVDRAEEFVSVFADFVDWIAGEAPFILCSWGRYDLNQFRTDCARHHLVLPSAFERHVNLKKHFASLLGLRKELGMERALAKAGLPLIGTHHRGIDDARNIARLAALVLPQLEAAGVIAPL